MGWTCGHREPGESHRDFFQREVAGDHKIIAARTVGTTFYAAVRTNDEIWALVLLMEGRPGSEFCWKAIEESQGPAQDTCPDEILDLLTETDSDHANEWRRRCRERNRKIRAALDGATIRFKRAYIVDGKEHHVFRAHQPPTPGGGVRFEAVGLENPSFLNLLGWKEENFEVVT